jgi:hypothetical protein
LLFITPFWVALVACLQAFLKPLLTETYVEDAIRPIGPGRKNWLFVDSPQACERATILKSLIELAIWVGGTLTYLAF